MKKETIKMQWKIDKYRKDRRTGALSPVKPSKYYKELLEGVILDEQAVPGDMGGSITGRIQRRSQ